LYHDEQDECSNVVQLVASHAQPRGQTKSA